MALDWGILNSIQTLRSPAMDFIMLWASRLGDMGIIWIAAAVVLLIFPKTRKAGLAVAAALLIDLFICNIVLKPLIARIRPCDINTAVTLLIPRPADFSFPSGHAAAGFAAASALFFGKNRLWIPALIMSVIISFSRMYLYVHFPTDILGGAAAGIAFGAAGSFLIRRLPVQTTE